MPFIKAGDLNVHYIESGQGEPVILVHGNWGVCGWWEPIMARLPSGMRGIAYDLRGRGDTEGPDNDYTMPEMAADLNAFADALGLGSFHLVGHSLGTAVAMEYTLEHPDRVLSLLLVAPAWVDGMPEAYNVPSAQEALKADFDLYAKSLKPLAPTYPEDDFWRRLVKEGHRQRLEAAVRNLPALVAWKPGDHLKETGVPALIISGTLDPLCGGGVAERAAQALNAKHIVLENIGHSPVVEAPDVVVANLVELASKAKCAS